MRTVFATLVKELLLLRRDKAGLAVLFLMPAILVTVISLVQDNILNNTGTKNVEVAFVDVDNGDIGMRFAETFGGEGDFILVREKNGVAFTPETAKAAVENGEYQLGVVIPKGCTPALRRRANALADKSFGDAPKVVKPGPEDADPTIVVFFDPIIQGSFRTAVTASLERFIQGVEIKEKSDAFSKRFPGKMRAIIEKRILEEVGDDLDEDERREMIGKIPKMTLHWSEEPVMSLNREVLPAPTAVQQNVPAWTLFGMFFIVVPLGGTLIRERLDGTLQRLRAMPTSFFGVIAGKMLAFVLVCMVQFALMIMVGRYVLPLFGTPMLEMGDSTLAIIVMAVSSALAATGYGILVGTVASSYEQASMFGSISVVTASAIGGIMVPVYVMPSTMKAISVYSPLAWGLNGFLDVFVRKGSVMTILPWAGLLIGFCVACLVSAWAVFKRQ